MLNLHFLACRLQLHTGTDNAIISVSAFMTRGVPYYFTAGISFHFLPSLFFVRFVFFFVAIVTVEASSRSYLAENKPISLIRFVSAFAYLFLDTSSVDYEENHVSLIEHWPVNELSRQ